MNIPLEIEAVALFGPRFFTTHARQLAGDLPGLFICAILAAAYTMRGHSLASLFAQLTGASLIFLGLYAFTYGYNMGLLFILTIDEIIEIGIKIYCLTVGPLLIYHGWKLNALNFPKLRDTAHA